jgi:Lar family restriction alleviation protein
MTTKPLHCPFCGSVNIETKDTSFDAVGMTQAWCTDCGACGPETVGHEAVPEVREKAVRAWNERRPRAVAEPFDPWSLPEEGIEYEMMTTNGRRIRGAFQRNHFGALELIYNPRDGGPNRGVHLEHIRVWRRVES